MSPARPCRWPCILALALAAGLLSTCTLVLAAGLLAPWALPAPARVLAAGHDSHAAISAPPRLPERCRGSTRARVAITWPTAADLATDRRLRWGIRTPALIRRWAYLIVPAAQAAGIDPDLAAAVMQVESHGDPLAWNLDSDARGLMQVLHASFEPAVNVATGVSMLGALQREFGREDLVLAAYNAGPGAVRAYGGIPPFTETRDYVILVDYYRDLFAGLPLSAARTARFNAANADLAAFKRRICGQA